MTTLREKIGNERRRLRQVRQALSAALHKGSGGNEAYLPFYIAVADYFDAAMARLHTQDVRMGEMIREKLGSNDPRVREALQELDDRLGGNREHLENFLHSRDALHARGAGALEDFERVSRAYTDYITANMGHHGVTTELAAEHFSADDWLHMADLSDEDTEREQQLFAAVFTAMPSDLDPEVPEA